MATVSVRYIGPHAEVEVADLDYQTVKRDEPVDVPQDVATRLLQQPTNWTEQKKGGK